MIMKVRQIFRYTKVKDRKKKEIDGFPNFSFYTDFHQDNSHLVLSESGISPIGKVKNRGTFLVHQP